MSEADKATVVNTPENDLIQFHHGLGTAIRKDYNLWQNQALVKATGKAHPDDAAMGIIKAVWQALQASGETYRNGEKVMDFVYGRNEILADGDIPGPPTSGNSEDY